jgi:hypothetical protein
MKRYVLSVVNEEFIERRCAIVVISDLKKRSTNSWNRLALDMGYVEVIL